MCNTRYERNFLRHLNTSDVRQRYTNSNSRISCSIAARMRILMTKLHASYFCVRMLRRSSRRTTWPLAGRDGRTRSRIKLLFAMHSASTRGRHHTAANSVPVPLVQEERLSWRHAGLMRRAECMGGVHWTSTDELESCMCQVASVQDCPGWTQKKTQRLHP